MRKINRSMNSSSSRSAIRAALWGQSVHLLLKHGLITHGVSPAHRPIVGSADIRPRRPSRPQIHVATPSNAERSPAGPATSIAKQSSPSFSAPTEQEATRVYERRQPRRRGRPVAHGTDDVQRQALCIDAELLKELSDDLLVLADELFQHAHVHWGCGGYGWGRCGCLTALAPGIHFSSADARAASVAGLVR